eukprot:236620-Pyramimonas_sp.AAC.1
MPSYSGALAHDLNFGRACCFLVLTGMAGGSALTLVGGCEPRPEGEGRVLEEGVQQNYGGWGTVASSREGQAP